ncbi:MAG: hypothetical protein SGBAC_009766 [Bacillariaceae sp.]
MTSRNGRITKTRIFMACFASIMVCVSSIYGMTFVFTKSIVKELILDQKDVKQNIRSGSNNKNLILDYSIPSSVQSVVDDDKKPIKKDAKPGNKKPSADNNKKRKDKQQKQTEKDKLRLGKKKKEKKQVWIEESSDIGEITSSGNILNDTTIIVTTNWMPSAPSTDQLDKVINSLSNLHGLPKDAPMIIAVDGAYENGARYESKMNVDMRAYVQAIRTKYNDKPQVSIIASDTKIMLVGNMKRSLRLVHTTYVLVLQHDLPFINKVNHTALVETMETNSNVRLVRFPTARVLTRARDGGVCEENEVDFEDSNGIQLTKTHVWSDRNHLTRKSYYAEMFQLPGWSGVRNMEFHMESFGNQDCKHWGTYLFGKRGGNPTIFHLDGRGNGQHMTSTKRVYGNLSGLLD